MNSLFRGAIPNVPICEKICLLSKVVCIAVSTNGSLEIFN